MGNNEPTLPQPEPTNGATVLPYKRNWPTTPSNAISLTPEQIALFKQMHVDGLAFDEMKDQIDVLPRHLARLQSLHDIDIKAYRRAKRRRDFALCAEVKRREDLASEDKAYLDEKEPIPVHILSLIARKAKLSAQVKERHAAKKQKRIQQGLDRNNLSRRDLEAIFSEVLTEGDAREIYLRLIKEAKAGKPWAIAECLNRKIGRAAGGAKVPMDEPVDESLKGLSDDDLKNLSKILGKRKSQEDNGDNHSPTAAESEGDSGSASNNSG